MDNWNNGWRKLVEWNSDRKVYIYKGHEVYLLSYDERVKMPTHLQNSYYWGEITRIDKVVEAKENASNANGQKELQEAMDMFWKSVET